MVIRLDKYLCDMQAGTRSAVKDIIRKKRVTINGEVITRPEIKVDIDKDVVAVDNNVLGYSEYEYYMLNKPAGVVSAVSDKDFKTVVELITDNKRKDLFPVGRLDKDTEGLLLITDDGMLAHELLAPGKHVDKTYFVRVEGKLTVENIRNLENGVDIGEEKLTMPAKVEIVGGSWEGAGGMQPGRVRIENLPEVYTELHLTIHEGKFHQVKRMMAAVGNPVIYLKRISMGPLTLPDNLKKGECRPLTEEELLRLKG